MALLTVLAALLRAADGLGTLGSTFLDALALLAPGGFARAGMATAAVKHEVPPGSGADAPQDPQSGTYGSAGTASYFQCLSCVSKRLRRYASRGPFCRRLGRSRECTSCLLLHGNARFSSIASGLTSSCLACKLAQLRTSAT